MARKRNRTQQVKPIFKLTHKDGKGIRYMVADTLVGACLMAGWDSARVDYLLVPPDDKKYQANKKQPTLPGI